MDPVILPANQPADRFYRGGAAISAFRGAAAAGDRVPEDWVASTTTVAGHAHLGLSHLPDGTLLRDAMVHDPVAWLGREHVSCYGVDSKLLVKLLDAGERLPVHAHPAAEFARRHLGRAHGKAEAWFVLAGGEVYLGLTRDVTVGELRALVDDQDVERLLSMLHRREVAAGDTVYVPPGTLHAIGAATFSASASTPHSARSTSVAARPTRSRGSSCPLRSGKPFSRPTPSSTSGQVDTARVRVQQRLSILRRASVCWWSPKASWTSARSRAGEGLARSERT
jgi:hypothetical protein